MRGSDDTTLFIKWMFCCNAAGIAAPLVLLIALPEMGEDDFESYEIPGLTYKPAIESGFIFFARSRSGNKKSFAHFIEHIVIKSMASTRNHFGLKVISGSSLHFLLNSVF